MPRKTRRRGVGPSMRGRHKWARSKETRIWNRIYMPKSLRDDANQERKP